MNKLIDSFRCDDFHRCEISSEIERIQWIDTKNRKWNRKSVVNLVVHPIPLKFVCNRSSSKARFICRFFVFCNESIFFFSANKILLLEFEKFSLFFAREFRHEIMENFVGNRLFRRTNLFLSFELEKETFEIFRIHSQFRLLFMTERNVKAFKYFCN